jgi:hypothetical protein
MKRSHALALLLLCLGGPIEPALAWDGTQTMIPGQIDVTDGSNLGFRVWGPSCSGAQNFAYLLNTDSNYDTYVAVILMAKAEGITVTFYTTLDASGFCHLGYLSQN